MIKGVTEPAQDERFVAAALRYGLRHSGLTGTNPSVATLLVDTSGPVPRIVGRGVTALGGRPHAERIAIDEAGSAAKGTTAYVTLEPCAHHGVTPPCAEALVAAGVRRVVTAFEDPDRRVDGEGHAMLRAAGIEVVEGVLSKEAAHNLAGYLTRTSQHRPHVHLKLAVSGDGRLGLPGQEIAITGDEVRAQVHMMRAESDAILIGAGTARVDDPSLTCQLNGLSNRSPKRIVLEGEGALPLSLQLFQTARQVPTILVAPLAGDDQRRKELEALGVEILGTEF